MSGPGSAPDPSQPAPPGGFLAPSPAGRPISHCIRCGKETPPGVSLCDADNPGGIKAPSATQLHATILVGVVAGFLVMFLVFRLLVDQSGPYGASIEGHVATGDGGIQVAVRVTNTGEREGVATCRITRDGTPRPDDLTFRTERLAPGASVTLTRTVPVPAAPIVLDPERMTVSCA
jgi:hypothetical protein